MATFGGTMLCSSYEINEDLIKENIKYVYACAPHAFNHGCGKKTMTYWWQRYTRIYFSKNILRRVLKETCDKSFQNELGYWCFFYGN